MEAPRPTANLHGLVEIVAIAGIVSLETRIRRSIEAHRANDEKPIAIVMSVATMISLEGEVGATSGYWGEAPPRRTFEEWASRPITYSGMDVIINQEIADGDFVIAIKP